MTKASTILEYLQHIGARKEAEMYLKLFRGVKPDSFAVIMANAATLSVYERDIANAIAYLSSLGLYPVIVHDATAALGKQLVSDVWGNGGKCQAIMAGLYTAQEAANGLVSKAKGLIAAGTTPVIEAEDLNGTLKKLLPLIKPGKLIILNKNGAVKTSNGEPLSYINLPHEYGHISKTCAEEYKSLLKTASEILTAAKWKLHVEIVPPNGLLTELFTIKGSGTFIKKGPKIICCKSNDVDKKRMRELLEKSFGRKLSSSYFSAKNGKTTFFIEENYAAAAVVERINEMHYIDKLAVLPEAQGEGLARDIITSARNNCKKVFWRAKPENHINEWYQKLCSGMQKVDRWFVYWSNLDSDEIKDAIKYASEKPADFVN
ncbi:hypothetical protein HYU18_04380 [Candidatus Woesearchaeota archaeon]|nr:hypothetical protein [Candidatus Woesearchaeota archaeon]